MAETYNIPCCGGEFEITCNISTTAVWEIDWDYPADDVQLRFNKKVSTGYTTFKITVLPRCNTDAGGSTVFSIHRDGNAYASYRVNQGAAPEDNYVNVNVSNITLNPSKTSETITISGTEWFARVDSTSDFELSKNTGSGNDSITVSFNKNYDSSANLIISSGCDSKTIPISFSAVNTPGLVTRLRYNRIICGSSPMIHYVPTGVTTPFTLDWSPLNTDNTNVLLPAFGVSDDYRQIWFRSNMTYNYDKELILRATFEDGNYEDIYFVQTEYLKDCYLTESTLNSRSWGYIVNSDASLQVYSTLSHTNSTTTPWINISGNNITLDANPTNEPRMGDVLVSTDDVLYIFTIMQRPDEQSDYFLAPDIYTGATARTVYIKSRTNKPIKRWWVRVWQNASSTLSYHYGTGDNPSFNITMNSGSFYADFVVEDNDGKVWGNCYSPVQLKSSVGGQAYLSKKDFDPYQSFLVFMTQDDMGLVMTNKSVMVSSNWEQYNLTITTNEDYTYVEIPVVPFGCDIESNFVYLEVDKNYNYLYTPTPLIDTYSDSISVYAPIRAYLCYDNIANRIVTRGATYVSDSSINVSENTTSEEANKYVARVLGSYTASAIIPIVQEAYVQLDPPTNSTISANILGGNYSTGPYKSSSWYISSCPDWIHPSIDSGTGRMSFDLDVDGNISESPRTGVVTVVYDDSSSINITVNQEAITIQWNSQPIENLRNEGGIWNGELTYNFKPDSVVVFADDWLNNQWDAYDDYLHIYGNVDPVGGRVDRTGRIDVTLKYLTNNGDTVSINKSNTVIQNGEDVTFYPEVTSVAPQGGLVMTTVTSQYPLTGYKSAISSVADITFNRVSDTEITLYASYPMAEQGVMDTIMLIGDEGFDNIPLTVVTQSKFELVWEFNQDNTLLSTDSTPESPNIDYVFGVVGYESSVDITDMTFTVDYLNGSDWITEITCDTDWQEIHIKAKDNRLGGLRRATITARSEQYEAAREFEIVQEGLSLYVYPTSGTVESSGGSVTFGVNDANVGWIGPDEIVIYLNGDIVPFTYRQHSRTLEVTIQVPANDSDQSRTLYYEILAYTANPAASATYAVTQSAFEWNMLDSFWIDSTATTPDNQTAELTDEIEYSSLDNLGTLEVTFDADWIQATGQSWIMGAGIINVAVEDNRLGSLRRCTMTIYSPTYNKTKTVTIVQQGFSMSNQNSGYTIDCAGGDVTLLSSCNSWIGQDEISIKGQIDGALVDLPFTINGGYITQNYTDVYVTLPSNAGIAREIEIQMHILALGNYFIFNVDQPSCDINIDTPEIHFEKEGGSREVYIEATGNWQIEVVGDWITVTPMNGSGEDVIEISVDPNNTQSDRTGYVYITNGIEREAIVITQGHIIPELYLKERYIKMPLEGGTTYVTLISNIDWTTEWEIQ